MRPGRCGSHSTSGSSFGTKRLTDGSLPKAPPKAEESPSVIAQATAAIAREAEKTPVLDLDKLRKGLKLDSLVNVQNLRTVQHLDSLKTQVQEASRQWEATLADIDKSRRRVAEIQTSIKAINLNELKTIERITSAITNVNNAYENVNELNETFKFYAKGEVHHITNNQRLTGFPLTIALSSTKGRKSSFTFDASFDRLPEIPVDDYRITAAGLPVGELPLGQADFLPSKITNGSANAAARVSVPGSRFDSNLKIHFRNLSLIFDRAPKNDLERTARDVLASISAFNVQLRLWNTGGPFDVALSTDLDNQLAAGTKQVIGNELLRLQNEIRSIIDQRVAEKR